MKNFKVLIEVIDRIIVGVETNVIPIEFSCADLQRGTSIDHDYQYSTTKSFLDSFMMGYLNMTHEVWVTHKSDLGIVRAGLIRVGSGYGRAPMFSWASFITGQTKPDGSSDFPLLAELYSLGLDPTTLLSLETLSDSKVASRVKVKMLCKHISNIPVFRRIGIYSRAKETEFTLNSLREKIKSHEIIGKDDYTMDYKSEVLNAKIFVDYLKVWKGIIFEEQAKTVSQSNAK